MKEKNNFVHRKARQKADETKTQYKCVKRDSFKCRAAFRLNDETLIVEKPNHEHNHGPPLQEMLARNALEFCFSASSLELILHLCPYAPKYGNVFIMFFKLVSNISVKEHARLVPIFVLVLIWIVTAYLLKL